MNVARDDSDLLVVTETGSASTPAHQYAVKGRGGLGVRTIALTDKKGCLAGCVGATITK